MYTVYKLEEDLSPSGMPYIGCTIDIKRRSRQHKRRLNLSYIPNLIPIQEFSTKKEARKFEDDLREENGWKREIDMIKIQGRKNVESGHLQSISSKAGKISGRISVESGHLQSISSKAGKIGGKKMKGKLWMNKNGENSRILPQFINQYLQNGWSLGRKPKK
jgi:predicted GIY-YIG superfamily endonuclease